MVDKMPKNTTGGKGHRSGQNSESQTTKKLAKMFDDLMFDIRSGADLGGLIIGRVTRKFGEGRIEVTHFNHDVQTIQAIIKGSLRGRGKKDAFIDLNSVVLVNDLGMSSGTTYEVISVFTPDQLGILKKELSLDARLFVNAENKGHDEHYEFENEEEIDVDTL